MKILAIVLVLSMCTMGYAGHINRTGTHINVSLNDEVVYSGWRIEEACYVRAQIDSLLGLQAAALDSGQVLIQADGFRAVMLLDLDREYVLKFGDRIIRMKVSPADSL